MNTLINKLYLNLNDFKVNIGSIEQCDTTILLIDLLKGIDYSDFKFRLLAKKSDFSIVEQIDNIKYLDNTLEIKLKENIVNTQGIVRLELNIFNSEINKTTNEFYFYVSSTKNFEIIAKAFDDINTLSQLSKFILLAEEKIKNIYRILDTIDINSLEVLRNELFNENESANLNKIDLINKNKDSLININNLNNKNSEADKNIKSLITKLELSEIKLNSLNDKILEAIKNKEELEAVINSVAIDGGSF